MPTISAQSNITWTTDSANEAVVGMYLWFDNNNNIYIGARATGGGKFGIIITQGGSQVYTDQDSGNPAKATEVKIEYYENKDIKLYYWTGAAWSQIGTTQNFDLGINGYLVLSCLGNTGWTGANPGIIDNAYLSHGTYSTQTPSTYLLFDDFDDNSIDTGKWAETDPNSLIAETSSTLRITTNVDAAEFANKLQSLAFGALTTTSTTTSSSTTTTSTSTTTTSTSTTTTSTSTSTTSSTSSSTSTTTTSTSTSTTTTSTSSTTSSSTSSSTSTTTTSTSTSTSSTTSSSTTITMPMTLHVEHPGE